MIRNTKLMTLLATGLVLFACQKERTEDAVLVPGKQLTFTATIDGAETRTSVDGTKISWNPAEEINIFYGASEGSKFVSQNTEPSQSVTFSGTLTAFTGTTEAGEPNSFWAIYPYDESNSSSGSSVTAYLPENQVGVPNNVPDKALMMVAKASGLALSFKQVCARIKVVVSTPGIERIEIRGDNDETIAGSVVITMNSQGVPEWQDAGTGAGKVIELVPASGTTFEEAEYSIPILPQTFSAGFTMTCYKDGEKGSYSTGAVTFGRNQVRTVNTNKVTEWTETQPNNVIYYTSSDGNVIEPVSSAVFGASIISNEYVEGRGIITFDADVITIGDWAFTNRNGLTSITMPESVTSIGEGAFSNCKGLTSITIPESVTSIGGFAFFTCPALISVTLPDSIITIGNYTFDGCTFLSDITIPESVTSIGERAFSGCCFNDIIIPESVISIGDFAFFTCNGLTSITIPESVISIGKGAFAACASLVRFSGKFASQNGLFLIDSGSILSTACGAMLGKITIPDGITSIGDWAFSFCGQTTDITIPESVISIGEEAFYSCFGLTSVTIPESVTTIGSRAFEGCSGLTIITVLPQTAPMGNQSILNNTNDCPIYVPAGSVEAYKSAQYWSDYADRIYAIGTPVAVDLGLPSGLKWASFNLGASKPEEYGDYFAWGETEPYYESGYAQSETPVWKEGKKAGYDWASYK